MPVENLEEEGLPKNPNLGLAQLKFLLTLPKPSASTVNVEDVRKQLLDGIRDKGKLIWIEIFFPRQWGYRQWGENLHTSSSFFLSAYDCA